MSKGLRIFIGIVLMVFAFYNIYMILEGNSIKADNTAKSNPVSIGESISDKDGVSFCVTSVSDFTSAGENNIELTTPNNLIVLSIQITNNGSEPYDVNPLNFKLIEGENEYEYNADMTLAFDNYMFVDKLNPGLSKEYLIGYETSFHSNERNCQLKISSNVFTKGDYVYINLY